MRDVRGVEAHGPDGGEGALVVLVVEGVVEHELGASLGGVALDGEGQRGTEDEPAVALLDEHEATGGDAQAAAEPRGDHDGAAGIDLDGVGVHSGPVWFNFGISESAHL
jgi:hypothetical protein